MSDILDGAQEPVDEAVDDAVATDAVGLTSDELDDDKKSLLQSMTIYDAMLLVSLICIGMATMMLFFELRNFGDFPSSFPWRTNEF